MIYWIKRKYNQVATLIWWIPKIWNNFDFDYSYSLNMLCYQLERQAEFLESNKANTKDAKFQASRIRTFLRLKHKIYEDEYFQDFYDEDSKSINDFKLYCNHEAKSHRILWAFFEHNIQKWWD